MKQRSLFAISLVVASAFVVSQAEAFTSKVVQGVTVGTASVADSTNFPKPTLVVQGSGDASPTPATAIDFGTSPSGFVNSGESIKVSLSTNLAGNRLLIYTNNLSASANPKFCDDTGKGNDGGGLVGFTGAPSLVPSPDNCKFTVPLVWGLQTSNVTAYSFTAQPLPSVGATNGVLITDRAHVRTFVKAVPGQDVGGTLDNLPTKMCDATATPPVSVTNTAGDGLYPQYFGTTGQNLDVCSNAASTVTINGVSIAPGAKIPQAEELSKNIAVVAFGFFGTTPTTTTGTAPNLNTVDPTDTISVTSPFYLPIAADFRQAVGNIAYSTNTLTMELVTQ